MSINEGVRPVIIKYEGGHMGRGYIDLLNVVKEERGGSDVYSYTVTALPSSDFGGQPDAEG